MYELLLPIVGVVLITILASIVQRRREQKLLERIKQAGHKTSTILNELDVAIDAEKKRKAFWWRQNPRGGA